MLHAFFHGHLTADPVTRKAGDAEVTAFRVASSRVWKDSAGNQKTETDYIDVEAWNGAGKVIQDYFVKGSEITGSGLLIYKEWKKNDVTDSKHIIRMEHFDFCGGTRREKAAA